MINQVKKLNKLTIIGPHKSGTKFCNKILINNFGKHNVSYEVRRHATGGPFKFSEESIINFKKKFKFEYLLFIVRERKIKPILDRYFLLYITKMFIYDNI